jgi:hypothetical protein
VTAADVLYSQLCESQFRLGAKQRRASVTALIAEAMQRTLVCSEWYSNGRR